MLNASMRAKAKLSELWVPRVDLVYRPANRRRFLLFKEVNAMEDQAIQEAALTPEEKELIKKVLADLYPLFEENKIPDSVITMLGKLVGYPAPEGAYPYPYPKYKYPYPKYPYPYPQVKELLEGLPNREEVETIISKALEEKDKEFEEVRKQDLAELEKAKAELEELRKAFAAEQDARERAEAKAQVEAKFPNLAKLEPSLVETVVSLRKAEGYEKLLEGLAKVEQVLGQSSLFKEIGGTAPEPEKTDILETRAQELLTKGLARTIEQARAKVLLSDPELYRTLRGGA